MCANVTGQQRTLVTLKMVNAFVKQDILEIIVQKVHILSGLSLLSFDIGSYIHDILNYAVISILK